MLREVGFVEIGITGLVNVPRLHRLGLWTVPIDRWISKLPFSASRGMYLCISSRSPAEKYRIVAVHGMIAHKRPYAELQVAGRPTVGHTTGSVADSPPTSNLPGGVFGQACRK